MIIHIGNEEGLKAKIEKVEGVGSVASELIEEEERKELDLWMMIWGNDNNNDKLKKKDIFVSFIGLEGYIRSFKVYKEIYRKTTLWMLTYIIITISFLTSTLEIGWNT
ncbi:hypothetical protein OSB04_031089 [Centaurea solstitialis]|uniref:Uncharacterized protein n=1 Tax=Centaurea solstitialis TaxID=347529 RepID=A0AA38W7S4_9ASTR|nr:hypothetical protein OSB04_031089 [Centaurea solstitialis]